MSKKCTKCFKEKLETEFAIKNKDKKHSYCKECFKKYAKQHYLDNKKYYLEKTYRSRLRKIEYLTKLREKPCLDCGIKYPYYVMEFDHRNPKEKLYNITSIVNNSWKRIKEELEKCDVVCANCHSIRTYKNHSRDVTEAMAVLETVAVKSV